MFSWFFELVWSTDFKHALNAHISKIYAIYDEVKFVNISKKLKIIKIIFNSKFKKKVGILTYKLNMVFLSVASHAIYEFVIAKT